MINPLVILFPRLFGCGRATLHGFVGDIGLNKVFDVLNNLNAVKVGESCTPADELGNYYFKLRGKWLVLVVEEYTAIKLIAPKEVIESIENELRITR